MLAAGSARRATLLLAVLPLVVLTLSLDAAHRRSTRARELTTSGLAPVVSHLPGSDLALSGGARWLRFPSLEEPGAAFSEGPAVADADPAGGMISPPRAVWTAEATP
jgi:hypothetical protein